MKRLLNLFMTVILFIGITTAVASSESYEIKEVANGVLRCGKALIIETPDMSKEKPTLFFFGGYSERSSAQSTKKLLNKINFYDNWNVCCVAIYRDNGSDEDWKEVSQSLSHYTEKRIREGKINPYNIYLDGYSNGATGVLYTVRNLHNLKFVLEESTATVKIKEVTLIEGTLSQVIRQSQIEELLELGIEVTLYVSETSDTNLSRNGRELIKQFKNHQGFTGVLVDYGHGNAIVALVSNEYANHITDGF